MGNQQSTDGSKLAKKDLERVQRRFGRLPAVNGKVSIATFESMVELGGNPFVGHLFRLFDTSGDGTLSLEEFTKVWQLARTRHEQRWPTMCDALTHAGNRVPGDT
jgi:hypothetical protein